MLGRYEAHLPPAPRQVITAWRGSGFPPSGYPEGLPFLPGVTVFVTEFPDGGGRPHARWLVDDPERDLVADVATACGSAGWKVSAAVGSLFPFPGRRLLVRRRQRARLILEAELEGGRRAVQLLEMV